MVIKRMCAWCGRYLGSKECQCSTHQSIGEPVTHGICEACKKKALAEIDSAPVEINKSN